MSVVVAVAGGATVRAIIASQSWSVLRAGARARARARTVVEVDAGSK